MQCFLPSVSFYFALRQNFSLETSHPCRDTASDYEPQFMVSSLIQTEIKAKRARHLPLPIQRHLQVKWGKGGEFIESKVKLSLSASGTKELEFGFVWFCFYLKQQGGSECPHRRKNILHQKALQQQHLETYPVRATLESVLTGQWLQ